MYVTRISTAKAFEDLCKEWNALAAEVPFRRWHWLHTWWECFGSIDQSELFVLAVRDREQALVGLAPWFVHSTATHGRVVRFLGSGKVCSDYLGLLVEPTKRNEVVAEIAAWLTSRECGQKLWDRLELDGVERDEPSVKALGKQLRELGNIVQLEAGLNCWRIQLPSEWDEYVACLSKSHRKQVRRADRRILQTGQAVLHTVRDSERLPEAFEILVDLHQRRRRSLGESGCFSNKAFARFLSQVTHQLLEADYARLQWLDLDGRPVAAEIHFRGGGITYAYQAGVEPEALDHEPGSLITIATLKQAIEEKQTAFDFLRGDEPYKAHFRAAPRPSIRMIAVPPRAIPLIRHNVWLAGDAMKSWIKTTGASR